MNRHLIHSDSLPLFVPTNNASEEAEWFRHHIWNSMSVGHKRRLEQAGVKGPPDLPLITYKGPLASDKQEPHDIQVRVSRNMGSRKGEPVDVRANRWIEQHQQIYAAFVQHAFSEAEYTKRGSAKFIAECLRRRKDLVCGKPFKLPNAYVTYMALRFMAEHPKHAGLFKTARRGAA